MGTKISLCGVAAFLISACLCPAYAQSSLRPFPITGFDLQESCLAADPPADQTVEEVMINSILAAQCWSQLDGFMSGVRLQNFRAREAGLASPVGAACVPDTLDVVELRQVVLEYIRTNPAARTQRTGIVLARAFETTFPCSIRQTR